MTKMTFLPLEIWKARERIKGAILRTPLVHSPALSRRTGCQIYLKMECWQRCGCFKVRGAINMLDSLAPAERERGLVTASSGNHAIAVAHASSRFGRPPTTLFLPEGADPSKVDKIKLQAPAGKDAHLRIVFHGQNYLEAYERARHFARENGATYVHSHAHSAIITGQGTIGLEIMADLPNVDAVLVPVGGGGLISGIATVARAISDRVAIIGVEPTAAPAAYRSLRDGVCYETIEIEPSLADGLLGGFGRLPFEICRDLVREVQLVTDDEIVAAMRAFQQYEQLMVEAASSVGLAALLSDGKLALAGQKVVLVITSRNIDADKFNRIIQES